MTGQARTQAALMPLFLIALGVVGIENALTRYFAVAKWSEYGYWIISIVMAGFALSGVVVALFRDTVARHGVLLRALLPAALVIAAAVGYQLVTANAFNPLQLQNPTTWRFTTAGGPSPTCSAAADPPVTGDHRCWEATR